METKHCNSKQLASAPSLFLSCPRRFFFEGEDVIVTIALVNFAQRTLVVNKRLQMIFDYKYREAYELRFQITGPSKTPILPLRIIEDRLWPYPKAVDFVELLPGGQWQQGITLSTYFDFSQTGMYRVIAEYHNDHDGHPFGLNAWTGELCSSPLEINIS